VIGATKLILVRHGETDWNRDEVFRGHADVPLNDVGRRQARAVAGALEGEPVRSVASSPLVRALETAREIASRHGLEARAEPGLNDIDYGDWEGVPRREVGRRWPVLYRRWREAPSTVSFPNGEALANVQRRGLLAVEALASGTHGDGVAVAVTHRVVLKAVVLGMLGRDLDGFWELSFANGSVTELARDDGRWRLVRLSDVRHLEGVGTLGTDF